MDDYLLLWTHCDEIIIDIRKDLPEVSVGDNLMYGVFFPLIDTGWPQNHRRTEIEKFNEDIVNTVEIN